jgi:hypothetical protein
MRRPREPAHGFSTKATKITDHKGFGFVCHLSDFFVIFVILVILW